ncbi:hypothetical protein HORIV_06020 [Vreelandella olivaria]|uniref:Uncharacterized protein n=1 Tax=Vreelandella olivaria TaxID=390919 RepID=A0ABM7GCE2_9GAMM|nr:hypothetical protein HORIV_06020 [Halomonas olivaria]
MHVMSQAIVNKRDCACITLVHNLLEQCTNVSFCYGYLKHSCTYPMLPQVIINGYKPNVLIPY